MGEIEDKVIIAITGASGVIYAKALLEYLYNQKIKIICIASKVGKKIWEWEIGESISESLPKDIVFYNEDDFEAPISSGTSKLKAMVIIPCSMGTLSCISRGLSRNLIQRAADVMLKEKRKLILVPRETPLNIIHLENMLILAKAGAIILPAMPAFYHKPKEIKDLVNFIVGKILDQLNLKHSLVKVWEGFNV